MPQCILRKNAATWVLPDDATSAIIDSLCRRWIHRLARCSTSVCRPLLNRLRVRNNNGSFCSSAITEHNCKKKENSKRSSLLGPSVYFFVRGNRATPKDVACFCWAWTTSSLADSCASPLAAAVVGRLCVLTWASGPTTPRKSKHSAFLFPLGETRIRLFTVGSDETRGPCVAECQRIKRQPHSPFPLDSRLHSTPCETPGPVAIWNSGKFSPSAEILLRREGT